MDNVVCFIHSCNIRGPEILEYLLKYIHTSGLKPRYIFINNIGPDIKDLQYDNNNTIITNYSDDISMFENATLKQLYFFSQHNPNYKILYLHTKGVSYDISHPFYEGIKDWIDFMLYSLVNKYNECLHMLNYVDTVGVDYRNHKYYKNPDHYSGNFWWANSNYIKTLTVSKLSNKYDAEFWLFTNNPTFVNIHTCPYGHYETPYKLSQYEAIINNRIHCILYNLDKLQRGNKIPVLYGYQGNYIDITDKCYYDNLLIVPAGDHERNNIFHDHAPGLVKYVKIGDIEYSYKENIRFRIHTQ